ncbi:MAG: hypothetical protein ACPGUV_12155 [Polyangiales bacterium]
MSKASAALQPSIIAALALALGMAWAQPAGAETAQSVAGETSTQVDSETTPLLQPQSREVHTRAGISADALDRTLRLAEPRLSACCQAATARGRRGTVQVHYHKRPGRSWQVYSTRNQLDTAFAQCAERALRRHTRDQRDAAMRVTVTETLTCSPHPGNDPQASAALTVVGQWLSGQDAPVRGAKVRLLSEQDALKAHPETLRRLRHTKGKHYFVEATRKGEKGTALFVVHGDGRRVKVRDVVPDAPARKPR